MNFDTYIKTHYLLTDGAMGTYFDQCYPEAGHAPEIENIKNPALIEQIHKAYIDAGARLLRTNSFASNAQTLFGEPLYKMADKIQGLMGIYNNVHQSYKIAQKAAQSCEEKVWIAGDIGPIPENGTVEDDELLAQYEAMADALMDAGAEIILFETFADYHYILPVIRHIKEQGNPFIIASFCLNKFGYTKSGLSAQTVIKTAEESGLIDCVGFNCGVGSTHMAHILENLDFGSLPVWAVPNSGYSDIIQDRHIYQENVSYFCENMKAIAGYGVNILGGCCGTTPEYTRALSRMFSNEAKDIMAQRHHFTADDGNNHICKSRNDFWNKLNEGKKVIAVELDPPHDGNGDKILQASTLLKHAGVDLITFSDSPMGKIRTDSILSAVKIQNQIDVPVMPHVSCRDKNVIAMAGTFMGAHMNGIRNMLIVTGDPVPVGDRNVVTAVYDFNSMRLMSYLKQMNQEHFMDDPIIYGGALNYGRLNIDKEIERMQKKCEAGADYFLTQPIYSDEDVERIRYIKSKIDTKIICGILPLVSYRNAMFMQNEIYGIHVPDEIVNRYSKEMSRAEGEDVGIEIALELVEKLKDVADGYYFMVPFNRASMICKIIEKMTVS